MAMERMIGWYHEGVQIQYEKENNRIHIRIADGYDYESMRLTPQQADSTAEALGHMLRELREYYGGLPVGEARKVEELCAKEPASDSMGDETARGLALLDRIAAALERQTEQPETTDVH